MALSLAIVALMALGSFGSAAEVPHGLASSAPGGPVASPASSVVSAAPPTASPAPDTAGACHETNGSSGPALRSSVSPSIPSDASHPAALYNSQVEPFASLTGNYSYVAHGAALRNQGYGEIDLTWPGTGTKRLVAAFMVWSIIDNNTPPAYGWLNGINVTGTWTAYATPSPCWPPTYIYTFAAEVTDDVVNGVNTLTNFPSGITNGLNPWSEPFTPPMDEGVSLIAVYSTVSPHLHQVTVYTGARTDVGGPISADLNYSKTDSSVANTTYIIADGQLSGNAASWNGTVIDANAFPGDDPKESTSPWTQGNLSDTKTFAVTVPVGSVNITAGTSSNDGDCFTWVGQVLSVGVAAAPPPYSVDFEEQGLPDAAEWSVTTDGSTLSGTVADLTSSIDFSVASNGTYDYSVTPIPGYTAPYSGAYHVDGGSVFIRVPFHVAVYPVAFDETGLPTTTDWWATLSNKTLDISDELYADAPAGFTFQVPNGTYNFTAAENGLYKVVPASGKITIDGTGASQTIEFVPPPLYPVTFVEQGLPAGTKWNGTVETNWGEFTPSSTTNSFVLSLPNASAYTDVIYPKVIAGYSSPDSIYFGVFAAARNVDVNFTRLYSVDLHETGLPKGTYWSVNLTGTSGTKYSETETANNTFSDVNGSYTFQVTHVWSYTAVPATGPVVVNGANVTVDVVFSVAPTYVCTFTETGLVTGTQWTVDLFSPSDQEFVQSSKTDSLTFTEPNGTYEFVVVPPSGYVGVPDYGYRLVDGAGFTQAIVFHQIFSVTINETGLPSGTEWYTYLNDSFGDSDSPTIVYSETNGTFPLIVDSVLSYTPTPSSTSVVVSGANVTETIVFSSLTAPTYPVTFVETGLPTGTSWSVTLNYYLEETTTSSLAFTEANGTLGFSVGGATGYTADPAAGDVLIQGGAVREPIAFSPTSADVTFSESGLPSGQTWKVTFDESAMSLTTDGATDTLTWTSVVDGTYDYSISGNPGWHESTIEYSGEVEVSGATVTEPTADYLQVTYLVTFTESGLPTGTEWFVNVTGGSSMSSTGTTMTLDHANGSFSYSAASKDKAYSAPGGSVPVNGAAVPVAVKFSTSTGSPGAGFLGLPGQEGYWTLIGIIVLALGLACLFLLARRRKKKEELPTPPAAGAPGGGGPTPPPPPA